MSLENRHHGAELRRNYVDHDHSDKLASVPDNQSNWQNMLLMKGRCTVWQGANCGHAQYYFAVLNFRGIAVSKGTSRQRSGKGAIRKRFPLQKQRREKKQTNNKVRLP